MADPISVAGAAVGVASLGIQVCQGLVAYISSIKGRTQEINNASDQIQHLSKAFHTLQGLIPRVRALPEHNASALAELEACINSTSGKVNELRDFLQPLQSSTQAGNPTLKSRVSSAGKALAYPFKEKQIRWLQGSVSSLLHLVETSIEAISLDIGISQRQDLIALKTSIATNHAASVQIRSSVSDVMTSLRAVGQDTHISAQILRPMAESIRNMDAITRRDATVSMNQHQELVDQIAAMRAEQAKWARQATRLLAAPALLREACDQVAFRASTLPCLTTQQQIPPGGSRKLSPFCRCAAEKEKTTIAERSTALRGLVLYQQRQESSRHVQGCPLYRITTRSRQSIGVRLTIGIHRNLSYLVDACLRRSWGAGGNAISPVLTYRVWVEETPASLALENLWNLLNDCSMPSRAAFLIERATWQVIDSFHRGEASPYDKIGADQETYLHYATDALSTLFEPRYHSTDTSLLSASTTFLSSLVSCGVPWNEPSTYRARVPIDMLLLFHLMWQAGSRQCVMCTVLLDKMSEITDEPVVLDRLANSDRYTVRMTLNICRRYSNLGLVSGACPIVCSILSRSEDSLRVALDHSSEAVFELWLGVTVLHLASWWPAGLSLLLEAGASELVNRTCGGVSPLDVAIDHECPDAVELLLKYGSVWNGFQIPTFKITELEPLCVEPLTRTLALRRRQLGELVRKELPYMDTHQLSLLPDAEARHLLECLCIAGIDVPPELYVSRNYEGIYHSGNLPVEFVPLLHEAGFHDLNKRRQDGLTLLMHIEFPIQKLLRPIQRDKTGNFPLLIEWLRDHQCLDQTPTDPLAMGINTSATCRHILALALGALLGLERVANLIRIWEFLNNDMPDSCHCWCSAHGCRPIKSILRSMADTVPCWFRADRSGPDAFQVIMESAPLETLRTLSFEALEMTHTCCFPSPARIRKFGGRSVLMHFAGDVQGIRDEEKELGARLNDLMEDFKDQYEKTGHGSLKSFVRGYWRRRMQEECVYSRDKHGELVSIGVRPQETYKTPLRLRRLLGHSFRLEDDEGVYSDDDEEFPDPYWVAEYEPFGECPGDESS